MTDALHARIDALIRPQQVHRDVYTSPEVYRLEMKHLFPNAWVYIGHDSQTPNKGDYITAQIGDQPLLMVRHTDNEIHVLYNRCPHKGTKIVIDRAGNTGKFFRCPYHAWSFKTDGCLLAIPLKKGYEGTGLEETEAAHGMAAVGAMKNYRGFVFARLAEAMGRPELAQDERYATHRARGARQEELDALIGEWTGTMTIAELEAKMIAAGVPAGRVYDAEDMLTDPHFAAREALVTVPDAELGEIRMQGVFPKLSATPGGVRRPAPLGVGQDTADVLGRWLER